MKYYLIAGEASGDLHGANLMKAIKAEDATAEFRYYGGDKMHAQGGELVKHYAEMAFMGFAEVLLNLRTIFRNMRKCKADLLAWQPDVLILIDFPGFNLRIAEFAHENKLPVCYYISPKIWAWNQKRALKIKRVVDKMFCILPFETAFYQKWGMDVDYVGNPILDEISAFEKNPGFTTKHDLNKPVIALLPGSRTQEIERLLPDMLSVIDDFPEYEFAIAAAPAFSQAYYAAIIGNREVKLIFNDTYNLLAHAHAALVASGTATLETALFNVPQVVLYKGSSVTIAIARMLVNVKYISLVNLIADKQIVRELIQQDCNHQNIVHQLKTIVEGHGRVKMLQGYFDLNQLMGSPGASARTAKLIVDFLSGR